jgi:hypothetical protein
MASVQVCGGGGDDVGQYYIDADTQEAASKVARVRHANPLLQSAVVTFPRSRMPNHYQVTKIVEVDHCASTR